MQTRIQYAGAVPGADENEYTLFSTVDAGWSEGQSMAAGLRKFVYDIENPNAGTLNLYKSEDHGTAWVQVSATALSAAGATDTNVGELLVEPYPDWKVTWTNGGSAQTGWVVTLALTDDRADPS